MVEECVLKSSGFLSVMITAILRNTEHKLLFVNKWDALLSQKTQKCVVCTEEGG